MKLFIKWDLIYKSFVMIKYIERNAPRFQGKKAIELGRY
jgi:hypothetical protein